jgi:hypothetical protein
MGPAAQQLNLGATGFRIHVPRHDTRDEPNRGVNTDFRPVNHWVVADTEPRAPPTGA